MTLALILAAAVVVVLIFLAMTTSIFSSFLSPREANDLLLKGKAVIVDVREHDEIKAGVASPALWFPTSRIEENPQAWNDFITSIPIAKTVVFYCAVGGRAGKVASLAKNQGYTVANMGGYGHWVKAGLPTRIPDNLPEGD